MEEARQSADILDLIHVGCLLALFRARRGAVPESPPRIRQGYPENEIVASDVVGDGAAREIDAGEVEEAIYRSDHRSRRAKMGNTD